MVNRLPPRGRSPAPVRDNAVEQPLPKPQRRPVVPPRFAPKKTPAKRSPLPPRFRGEIKALADAARARRTTPQDSD
jgi:hypothetical protein